MTIIDFFNNFGQFIALTLFPIILWLLGIKYQNRKQKQDKKSELFLTLMANRKMFPPTKEWLDSLNTIDVVFQDNANVRNAWKDYYESLHTQSINNNNSSIYLLSLLSEMANSLNYKKLKQVEIDRFYSPQYLQNQFETQNELTSEMLRVIKNSSSFAESQNNIDNNLEAK